MATPITSDTQFPMLPGITDDDKLVVVTAAGLRKILKSSLLLAMGQVTVDDSGFANLTGDDLAEILAAVDTALGNVSGAAEDITIADAGGYFVGTDAEAALAELGPIAPEDDADGVRVPLRDENGVVQGYVGWSAGAGGIAVWAGDETGAADYDAPVVVFLPDGSLYFQDSSGGQSIYLDPANQLITIDANARVEVRGDKIDVWADQGGANGVVSIDGQLVKFFNTDNAPVGVDGTATPTTAAELADVLVDLGVIASHTIT